ncbi:MAG: hypothetical protein Q7J98_03230 [Kiritimatiellia bacterium]|nr:hypothetical protein [Kiritimatiellia bacterium]
MNTTKTDHFLSEEDLDLQDLSREELIAWWNLWLEQAQITNDQDKDEYSHGVFRHQPRVESSQGIARHDKHKISLRNTLGKI